MALSSCPCGSGRSYADCCKPLHQGSAKADTATQLMRSRYSAYALKLSSYLVDTTHPDKRYDSLAREIMEWATACRFTGLEILQSWQGETQAKIGKVEFIAHYLHKEVPRQLHEISRFRRHQKHWFYFDGVILAAEPDS